MGAHNNNKRLLLIMITYSRYFYVYDAVVITMPALLLLFVRIVQDEGTDSLRSHPLFIRFPDVMRS